MNSIPLHLTELENNSICRQHFDILGFCETKLTSDIENLSLFKAFRHSGGLAIYVKDAFRVSIKQELSFTATFLESFFNFEFTYESKSVSVGVVYRWPRSSVELSLTI